jgi:hypothetical protein
MKYIKTLFTTKTLMILAIFSLMIPLQELTAQGRRPAAKPAARPTTQTRPTANKSTTGNRTGNVSNSGNRTNNVGSNNNRGNNNNVNINIDNSKDVRINNNRNTVVRHNPRPYPRPPHVYGGFHYRCYHPFYFHPYRPFVWGPRWHPWGFFLTTLAVTAILISVDNVEPPQYLDLAMMVPPGLESMDDENQQKMHGPYLSSWQDNPIGNFSPFNPFEPVADGEYWYDEGVFYLKGDGGYTVVSAPLGAKIKSLPSGYETITLDDNTKNYYYGGAFYEKTSSGYTVVAPVAGSVVTNVSEGGEEVKMGDVTYVKLGETYYQPIQMNGKNMYEVVDVEKAQ